MNHDQFMNEALILAKQALSEGDFPVGCVIVHRGAVIARGRRTSTSVHAQNEIDHAEINALRQIGTRYPRSERHEMILYATMEPCLMCFAAILLSGIRQIAYAFEDPMGGGTALDRTALPSLYSEPDVVLVAHVMRKQSLDLFKRFFLSPENQYWKGSALEAYTLSAR